MNKDFLVDKVRPILRGLAADLKGSNMLCRGIEILMRGSGGGSLRSVRPGGEFGGYEELLKYSRQILNNELLFEGVGGIRVSV
jgi:hypothetical protein